MIQMTLTAADIRKELEKLGNPAKAEHHLKYFKTGPGEYGEGDIFIGVTVPEMRKISKKTHSAVSMKEVETLISSPIHEHRQTALFILVEKYNASTRKEVAAHSEKSVQKGESAALLKQSLAEREEIMQFYLKHLIFVNNWDLVDSSASYILGAWFLTSESETFGKETLFTLSRSENLWAQRVSVMTTHAFIKSGIYGPTLGLCEYFLPSKHDLMHKCTGWMLREIGKKDKSVLLEFLNRHSETMPRTMLRYSIEKMKPDEKEKYMIKGKRN